MLAAGRVNQPTAAKQMPQDTAQFTATSTTGAAASSQYMRPTTEAPAAATPAHTDYQKKEDYGEE